MARPVITVVEALDPPLHVVETTGRVTRAWAGCVVFNVGYRDAFVTVRHHATSLGFGLETWDHDTFIDRVQAWIDEDPAGGFKIWALEWRDATQDTVLATGPVPWWAAEFYAEARRRGYGSDRIRDCLVALCDDETRAAASAIRRLRSFADAMHWVLGLDLRTRRLPLSCGIDDLTPDLEDPWLP